MTTASRANVVSSFTIVKGAMVEETYAVFAQWDLNKTKTENLQRLRDDNYIGASSSTWLRDVSKVINRRFDPSERDRPLVELARGGCDLAEWKPILLWHMTRDEFLVRDFLIHCLFPAFEAGVFRIDANLVVTYLQGIEKRGAVTEHTWSDETTRRVVAGLLKIAVDFGLLRGSTAKEFATYHLPEKSFLYILHALADSQVPPAKLISSEEWRMFLMRPADVEHELLRLHQFRRVEYHVAGSLVQLSLPSPSAREFAERMVA